MKATDIKEYMSLVKIKYCTWSGLVLQFILFTTIFLPLVNLLFGSLGRQNTLWFYLFINLILVVIWFFSRIHLPKNSENTIGLVVALHCEDDLESIGVKNDFINQLKRNLREDGLDKTITIVKIPNHRCSQITTYERAKEINRKARGHYLVFGEVVKRPDGEEKIFINMSGLVTHRLIPIEVSRNIAQDFCQSLPKEIEFLDSFRFRGFLLSADIVYLSAKYIIGVTAFVSGDIKMANTLHEKLINDRVLANIDLPPNLAEIKSKVNALLAEEYLVLAKVAMFKNDNFEYEKFMKLSIEHGNNIYGSHLFNAIKIFSEKKDADQALEEVQKAKGLANGAQEWRYSEAFLLYWTEKYEEAYKSSRKIIEHEYVGENLTIEEIIIFNERLIKDFPDKNQLYFWLGYVVYKKQNDLVKALNYFELFEKNQKPSQKYLSDRSVIFLKDIKSEMGIDN